MSAILGVFGPAVADGVVLRMLGTMRARGADRRAILRTPGATLAVVRHDWECDDAFGGPATVVDGGDCVVVADASLYYRADLRRKLAAAGVPVAPDLAPTELVLAAYRAWGTDAARELEGDFAFIVWDRRSRRVTCSRDFGGKRPLFHAAFGESFVVASSMSAVVEHPGCSRELNLAVLAETVAQLRQGNDETAYLAVRELLGANTAVWSGGTVQLTRNWQPPPFGEGSPLHFEEAAEELRSLLQRAVSERFAPTGPTAVWMSGGWDSSAVFAASKSALAHGDGSRDVLPVSISYPEGDPGREDELIEAIAGHWHTPVHWLHVDDIPLIDRPEEGAAARDLPFAHTYEHWNRALASGSRAVGGGARVAFDGNGGDQLFQLSDIYLSDLMRGGRWLSLRREWRTKGGRGVRNFLNWSVVPALPDAVRGVAERVRGRVLPDLLRRTLPPWIDEEFATRAKLAERERASVRSANGERGWRREARFYLEAPLFPRAFQTLAGFGLEGGVELRSPLYDRRVVEFACSRPREERNSGRETKRLLRRAMRGLLPEHVLAPRTHRTGITTAYSDRSMRRVFPALMERVLDAPMLGELGVVNGAKIREGWQEFVRTGRNDLKIPLFLTLHVELWLRARLRSRSEGGPGPGSETGTGGSSGLTLPASESSLGRFFQDEPVNSEVDGCTSSRR